MVTILVMDLSIMHTRNIEMDYNIFYPMQNVGIWKILVFVKFLPFFLGQVMYIIYVDI